MLALAAADATAADATAIVATAIVAAAASATLPSGCGAKTAVAAPPAARPICLRHHFNWPVQSEWQLRVLFQLCRECLLRDKRRQWRLHEQRGLHH